MSLTLHEQHFVAVAATTAIGDLNRLNTILVEALHHEVPINALKELLIQLYAYCGFPRSLNGLSTLLNVLETRKAAGIHDQEGQQPEALPLHKSRFELGDEVQQRLVGHPVKSALFDFVPTIDAFLKEHLFADIFLRGVLTYREREVITIAALAAIGVESQLKSHLKIGMNTGLTQHDLIEIADTLQKIVQNQASDLVIFSLKEL